LLGLNEAAIGGDAIAETYIRKASVAVMRIIAQSKLGSVSLRGIGAAFLPEWLYCVFPIPKQTDHVLRREDLSIVTVER
jgi:hypothetical protein